MFTFFLLSFFLFLSSLVFRPRGPVSGIVGHEDFCVSEWACEHVWMWVAIGEKCFNSSLKSFFSFSKYQSVSPFFSLSLSMMDFLNSTLLSRNISTAKILSLNPKHCSMSLGKRELRRWEAFERLGRMTDAFEMSKYFPKEDPVSGLNLTQRPKAFWIDHYDMKLFSWLYNEAFREAAL